MNNKFCRYCGTQNNYDYIYCKKCGKLLDAESDIVNNPNVSDAADFNQPNPSVSPDLNTGDGYSNGAPNGSAPYGNPNQYNNAPYGNGYPNGNPYNPPYGNPNAPNTNPPYTPIPDSIDGVNTEDVA
ncbi:MAG: hypothetical protein II257_04550, partial [Clostridia bacterium]|nr:hypothetical protein [Clostridia bacterium]